MEFREINYEVNDGIARLTLNNPAQLNALTWGTWAEIENAIRMADADDDTKVIVITGAGRGFSAGTNLSTPQPQSVWPDRPFPGREGMMRSRTTGAERRRGWMSPNELAELEMLEARLAAELRAKRN